VETETPLAAKGKTGPLVSRTGQVLSRSVTFQFALDPTLEQRVLFAKCAGARRYCVNHHLGRVKENLDLRVTEREAKVESESLTPGLSWSAFSFINEFNAWKNGLLETSLTGDDGERGLHWRNEIPESVFECASSDAARSLKNWSDSRKGERRGATVGFPRFAAKGRSTPSFRLRNRTTPGETNAIRFTDASHLRLPKIGSVKVHGPTRRARRMIELGRFHAYSATVIQRGGRWLVSLSGVATEFHQAQRSPATRHRSPVGVDRGITSLAVCADANGHFLAAFEGVRELRTAEQRLIAAQKTLARTTPGSTGCEKARARLNRRHCRVALTRKHLVHQASSQLVRTCAILVLEDLNVAGMTRNRRLAKSVSDAAMGELRRQIEYKAKWHGVEVILADWFFPSSKTCSGCGQVKDSLDLSERIFTCTVCGLTIDRDLNAAVNLARWTPAVAVEIPST
jgi:putative transposase